MITERLVTSLRNTFLIILLLAQPIFLAALAMPVQAQTDDETGNGEELTAEEVADLLADFQSPEDLTPRPADILPESFYDLQLFDTAQGRLVIPPEDQQALENGEIDIRVTDYLMKLVLPQELGGEDIDHIKVARLQRNYTSEGNGKLDREGADALDEGGGTVSTHNKGQAVDISEVGTVTCKLVYKRHLGGSTTKFQKPKPVKVSWQSTEGIANSPTPSSQSLLGATGDMTAQSILSYLNDSGEMDYYIDFVKGMDLKTIVGYVGANVYLKTFGINQVLSDPLADGLLHTLGGALLEKNLPGLPKGFSLGNNDDDARVAFAKARIEQGFNLPSGSLRGYGWDTILQGVGKRHLETSLGLPALYFENHTLDNALESETVRTALDYLKRSDDGLNLMIGTVEKIKAKDERGFKMAGVSLLSDAFRLTAAQRATVEEAVRNGKTPDISLDGVPAGNTISPDALKGLFSSDSAKQKEAENSLKEVGKVIVQEAAKKATKGKYGGLTDRILQDLLNDQDEVRLGNIKERSGAGTMGIDTGATSAQDNKRADFGRYVTQNAATIASFLNTELGLNGTANPIGVTDINSILDGKTTVLAEKIGAAQVDKAFHWNNGTAYAVINNQKNLKVAAEEALSNFVGTTLGLRTQGVSLQGNIAQNYGYAILAERLGVEQELLRSNDQIRSLIYGGNGLGPAAGYQAFKIFSSNTLTELLDDDDFWEAEQNTTSWKAIDIALGVTIGTTRAYVRDEISTPEFAARVGQANMVNLTADVLYDHFDIDERFRLGGDEIKNLLNVLSGKEEHQTLDNIESARTTIYRLLGRSVDSKADYSLDTFFQYITSPTGESGTKLLLDQGLRLFTQSLGANLDNYSYDDFVFVADMFKEVFGRGNFENAYGTSLPELERLRQEYDELKRVPASNLAPDQRARLNELSNHNPLQRYITTSAPLATFIQNATGIPADFRIDAEALIRGDYRTAIAAASFAATLPVVNPYLPDNGKISYAELRSALIIDGDGALVDARATQLAQAQGATFEVLLEDQKTFYRTQAQTEINGSSTLKESLRRQVLDDNRRNVEYHLSDSLLRKNDPTIPVGFSKAMFSGTDKIRGQALESWAFNHIDVYLAQASPLYVKGALEAIYNGGISNAQQDQLILNLISNQNTSFGPFSNAFMGNFYQFARSRERQNFFTDTKYQDMWGFFDGWIADNLAIGDLPDGLAKSVYYAAQNDWNLDKRLVENGQTVVPSLNDLGQNLLINRLSSWGDNTFGFSTGTMYQTYQLTTSLIQAQTDLQVAHAAKLGEEAASAQYSRVRGALILFAVQLALAECSECQKLFGTIDTALAAPAGFTQALAVGLLAQALGQGPAGIYIAAAIYLFGVYKVEYTCPKPPKDIYALTDYDPAGDKLDYGIEYDDIPLNISGSPPAGVNPFDWDNNLSFGDGNKPQLWMGWGRYYVGRLLDLTVDYGELRESPLKPQQILTYRQANVEFFIPRAESGFGEEEQDNPYVGMGYSQTTTKTTDWVHISFGGAI